MEPDPPLIEIPGEDDSLLQQTLEDTSTSSTVINYFSCSTLRIPDAKNSAKLPPVSTKSLDDCANRGNPTRSSPKSSSNTKNIRTNKVEVVPKLSMEPLQMKKRKKGGGYNLRKSLAWDRAFFTEEGVLDPLELSMISGSFGSSCGEALSVIIEDSDCSADSLEGTLHKEFPSPSLVGDKRKGSCFHTKADSSPCKDATPTSLASRKVLSTHRGKTETKAGGCLRPLASSLKRPANMNTARAAGKKDSKLPKVPNPKQSSSPLPTTARTKSSILSESQLKHNQIAQPVINLPINVGLKKSSQNFKGAQSKARPGPNCPSSPPKSTTLEVNLTENPNAVKTQNRYSQTVKPSGLRMPSPSLGFFGQPKASGSHSLLQKSTQSSNIPKPLQKFSELRPKNAPSTLNSVSHKIRKLGLEVNTAQNVEIKVPNERKYCQPIRSEHDVDDIIKTNLIAQEPKEHNLMEKVAYIEEAKSNMNNSKLLLQSGSCKKLREGEFKNSSMEISTFVFDSDLGDLGSYDRRLSCITDLDQQAVQTELSEVSQTYETGDKRNTDDKILECSGSESDSHKVQESKTSYHSPAGVSKVWSPHEIIPVERCERNLSTSGGDKQENLKVGYLSEQSEEHLDNDYSLAKSLFCEESLVEEVIESIKSGCLERNGVIRSESSDSELFRACDPDQGLDIRADMDKTAANPSIVNNEKLICEITSSDSDASLSKEPVLSVGIVQEIKGNEPRYDVFVEEAELNSSIYNSDQKSKNREQAKGVVDSLSKSPDSGTKKNKLVSIKPPSNAVPFSDEWLAAIEAAGEDILTMKGGAVQNSPPDKSQPEPSPWSPVKKKNSQIGPFDCTKCTNTLPAD